MNPNTSINAARKQGVSRVMSKPALVLAIAGVSALGLVGCSSSEEDSGTIKVAVVGDMTGSGAAVAGPLDAGFRTYIRSVNDSGGVNGTTIELPSTFDTQSDATTARSQYERALADSPIALANLALTSQIQAGIPVLTTADTPVLSAGPESTLLGPPPVPWFFSITAGVQTQAELQVAKAQQLLGGSLTGKKIAIVYVETPGGEAWMKSARTQIEAAGATVINPVPAPLQLTSFPQAAPLAAAAPDLVLTFFFGNDNVPGFQALQDAGYSGPIVANVSVTASILERAKNPNIYAMSYNPMVPPAAVSKAISDAGYGNFANDPWAEVGYGQAAVLVEALEVCGEDCDTASLMSSLQDVRDFNTPEGVFDGVLGFSADDHTAVNAVSFYTWSSAGVTPSGDLVTRKSVG